FFPCPTRFRSSHFLAALGEVAASIGRLPGPGRIKGAAAVTGGVGDGADNRNGVGAAVVGRSGRIESPGGPLLHRLIGAAASDYRRGGIDYSHFLAAFRAVAASIRRLPAPGHIEGAAAMTGRVCDRANDRNGVAAAVVGRSGRIEGPGGPLLHRLIGAAASNHWLGGIDTGHFLTALGEVAASIGRLPGPGRIKGAAAMTGGVGDGADNRNGVAAAVVGRSRRIEGPGG